MTVPSAGDADVASPSVLMFGAVGSQPTVAPASRAAATVSSVAEEGGPSGSPQAAVPAVSSAAGVLLTEGDEAEDAAEDAGVLAAASVPAPAAGPVDPAA